MTRDKAYELALRRIKAAGGKRVDLLGLPIDDLAPLAEALHQVPGLYWLNLENTNVTDLSPIAAFSTLYILGLNSTSVTNLEAVAQMTALSSLWINSTKVTDLSPLQDHPSLKTLSAQDTEITSVAALGTCLRLQTLALYNSKVADISPLQPLSKLSHLDLDGSRVTDLRPIQSLDSLVPKTADDPFLWGLTFKNTPATENDPQLAELSEIENNVERTRKTLDYLKTLPPFTPQKQRPANTTPTRSTALRPKPAAVRELMQNDPSAFADHVMTTVEQLQSELAIQRRYIPNDPEDLQDWEQLTGTIQTAITALTVLHPAIPSTPAKAPTEEDVTLLAQAFEKAAETLRAGCDYADRATKQDPGHHAAQFHKIGICVALGGVLAIPAAITAPVAIPAVASILYGKDFAKSVIQHFKPGSGTDP